jgi:hypothetical protein
VTRLVSWYGQLPPPPNVHHCRQKNMLHLGTYFVDWDKNLELKAHTNNSGANAILVPSKLLWSLNTTPRLKATKCPQNGSSNKQSACGLKHKCQVTPAPFIRNVFWIGEFLMKQLDKQCLIAQCHKLCDNTFVSAMSARLEEEITNVTGYVLHWSVLHTVVLFPKICSMFVTSNTPGIIGLLFNC